jgi:hypothetical protein
MTIATLDETIEEATRRFAGAFYTPKARADKAHTYMYQALGTDWKKRCLVWEPSAGTGNLTREYEFSDLVLSTVSQDEVDVLVKHKVNDGAVVEKLDFLNEDIPPSIHAELIFAKASGKPLIFFMNPPYAASGSSQSGGASKAGVSVTEVKTRMKAAGVGRASLNLYTQFMYRCAEIAEQYGFKEYYICSFTKTTFIQGASFKKFRPFWFNRMTYLKGFGFGSGEFNGTSNNWMCIFTIWKNGAGINGPITVDLDNGNKVLDNTDNHDLNKYLKRNLFRKHTATDKLCSSSGFVLVKPKP